MGNEKPILNADTQSTYETHIALCNSYILCSTPRTGSTLLCSLLKATKVAGNPESHFRSQDIQARVDQWGIHQSDGSFNFQDFLQRVLERGRSDNGIFATRIMWGTMSELATSLRSTGIAGTDIEVLTAAFGTTKFIYLERRDRVAQAISRLRAEQTNVWHITHDKQSRSARHGALYDRKAIQHYIDESEVHAREWNLWFQKNDIVPLRMSYEELDLDNKSELRRVLEFIGVEHPTFPVKAPNVRMSDKTSADWAARFRTEKQNFDLD